MQPPIQPDPDPRPVLPGDGQMRQLQPAIRAVWSLKNGIGVSIALAFAVLYDLTGFIAGADRALPHGTVTIAVIVFGIVYAIIIPRLQYRFWRFALREEELLLERGIINRVRTVVPLRRIQHLDVSQDIIEREYDLGKLIVHTAGTRSSDVILPGLDYEEAEALRETIKHYVIEDTF